MENIQLEQQQQYLGPSSITLSIFHHSSVGLKTDRIFVLSEIFLGLSEYDLIRPSCLGLVFDKPGPPMG